MDSENKEKLLAIFNDDPFGLLEVKQKSKTRTEDERLIASFEEINDFFEKNGREPQNLKDIKERKLLKRLEGFKNDYEKALSLKDFDRFNLLGDIQEPEEGIDEPEQIDSVDDIFNNDSLGLLDTEDDIFTFKHTPKKIDMPSNKATGKKCEEFDKFEHLFKEVHNNLNTGKMKLIPYANEQDLEQGSFFILKGIMVFIAHKGQKEKSKGKTNARLRVIYENGTESNLLLRSLSRELYRDGRRIVNYDKSMLDTQLPVSDEDTESGFIYILKSKSNDPKVSSMKNLFKIGFSRDEVEKRIKNAPKEPTYLMAPVSIISAYQCFNMNPQKLENLLHKFFGNNCLDIEIYDEQGLPHKPKEWFIAPLEIIEQAISLIISSDIIHYKYDDLKEEIVSL